MDLQIRINGTKLTDDLREFIDRRTAKLDQLVDHVVDAQMELKTTHQRSGGDFTVAQITVQTGRHILRAEESAGEATKAVDAAVDKLTRQLRRYHDKRTNRKRRLPTAVAVDELGAVADGLVSGDELATPVEDAEHSETVDDGEGAEETNRLVRTKRFSVKPMAVDEAIDQMNLIGHDFYLFHNADEDQLNVLYRRRDGTLGLLAPTRV